MKKRLLGLMLSVVTAIACLVGCSGSEGKVDGSNGGKELTELTFWHSMGGKGGEAINSLVEEFYS